MHQISAIRLLGCRIPVSGASLVTKMFFFCSIRNTAIMVRRITNLVRVSDLCLIQSCGIPSCICYPTIRSPSSARFPFPGTTLSPAALQSKNTIPVPLTSLWDFHFRGQLCHLRHYKVRTQYAAICACKPLPLLWDFHFRGQLVTCGTTK
jgi:hypothetical protein